MRKFLIGFLMVLMVSGLFGCAGLNVSTATSIATDTAFVLVLQNNPSYKPAVVAALQSVKLVLSKDLTYDDLILEISKAFGGKYAVVGVILTGYLDTDQPIFTSNLTLFQAWKDGAIKKIDRFILLAGTVGG